MRGLRGELYGPKEQHRQGRGGVQIERMRSMKPVRGSSRSYLLSVSNQSQRNLEGPAVNSKRYGRRLDDLGDLQKRLLAVRLS